MPDIPDTEPTEFIAGDTVKWTRDFSADYPVGTWTLTYYFRGEVSKSVTCTTSGILHLATISAATSATYLPGTYTVKARVSNGSEVYTVWEGSIVVVENPGLGNSYDGRTTAKKMLDAVESALLNNASREEEEYEIAVPGGTSRRLKFCSKEQLIILRAKLQAEVEQEQIAERIKQGKASGTKVLVRFQAP